MDTSERFGRLMGESMRKWTDVLSPVLFMMERQGELLPVMRLHKTRSLEVILSDKKMSEFFAPALGSKPDGVAKHIEATTKTDADRLFNSIFEGALVFGHAVLDDALSEALSIGYEARPEYFRDQVAQRKVSLADLQASTPAAVLDAEVRKWLAAKERESVLVKFDALFALVKPKNDPSERIDDFKFDQAIVKEIDDLRHSLAHGSKIRRVTFEDLNYIRKCTMLVTVLLNEMGMKTDPDHVIKAITAGLA